MFSHADECISTKGRPLRIVCHTGEYIVVLDNLGSHKGKAPRAAVRARGAHLIFPPLYSPDLNPIEQMFAKLKHLMRKAHPRGVEATWRKVGHFLDLFSPQECANYIANSGYGSV